MTLSSFARQRIRSRIYRAMFSQLADMNNKRVEWEKGEQRVRETNMFLHSSQNNVVFITFCSEDLGFEDVWLAGFDGVDDRHRPPSQAVANVWERKLRAPVSEQRGPYFQSLQKRRLRSVI